MAKLGEGDPRWLVEDRPDGTNVNNWHWTEKDCLPWTKKHFPTLFQGIEAPSDDTVEYCKLTTLDSITGEVNANARKGKIFFFYELEIKVNWEGKIKGDTTVHKGKINVPNLSEENDDDDFEVRVTVEGEAQEGQKLKSHVQKHIVPVFRKKVVEQYLKDLRAEHASTLVKPTKDPKASPQASSSSSQQTSPAQQQQQQQQKAPEKKQSANEKTLKMRLEFRCGRRDMYDTFTDPNRVMAFTASPASIAPQVGFNFALFGGSVQGQILELVPPEKIVQKWRFATWPEGHFSTVTLKFTEEETGTTTVELLQTGVPYDDADRTEQGWKNYFWERIKMVFGYPYQTKKV